jgi:hypothetical protein
VTNRWSWIAQSRGIARSTSGAPHLRELLSHATSPLRLGVFAAQEREYGEDAPVSVGAPVMVSVRSRSLTRFSTASSVTTSLSALPRFERPSAMGPRKRPSA